MCYHLSVLQLFGAVSIIMCYHLSVLQLLSNSSHLVRARCLELIGELGSCDDKSKEPTTADNSVDLLGQYTGDNDPRVRTAAYTAMVSLG